MTVFLPQADTPTEQRPSILSTALGGLLGGTIEGAAKDFTDRRSKRKLGDILNNPELSFDERMNAVLTSPGVSQEDRLLFLKNAQFQQQQNIKMEQIKDQYRKDQSKNSEKIGELQGALSRVNRMRDIGKKGNIGRGSNVFGLLGGETSKDILEYQQLGKSLVSFSSIIPPKNQAMYNDLSKQLTNASLSKKSREGVLDAMEKIISDGINKYGYQGNQQPSYQQPSYQQPDQPQQSRPQEKRTLESFKMK